MRHGQPSLHPVGFRVQRAEAHRPLEERQGVVGATGPDAQETAEESGRRQVGIEHQRPVEQGDASVEVVGEVGEGVAAASAHYRLVLAPLHRPARQAGAFGDLALAVRQAAVGPAPEMAPPAVATPPGTAWSS